MLKRWNFTMVWNNLAEIFIPFKEAENNHAIGKYPACAENVERGLRIQLKSFLEKEKGENASAKQKHKI